MGLYEDLQQTNSKRTGKATMYTTLRL